IPDVHRLRHRTSVSGRPERVGATLAYPRRGGRAVECGGLENRFGLLGPTRVQIPPPPLNRAKAPAPGPLLALLARAKTPTHTPLRTAKDCPLRVVTGAELVRT